MRTAPLSVHPSPPDNRRRLTDDEILERVDAIYEYVTWMADAGAIDFDYVADLAPIIAELRLRGTGDAA